ncbi:hypothetical protein ABW20_dc0110442 [Dactylellina cionopaga]|nr:hypothetical protein ABW20_dc0110442 [Dactylellina cionopaga]
MRVRPARNLLLSKDPTTAAEAGQAIHTLSAAIGWSIKRKANFRRPTNLFQGEKSYKCTICGDTFLGFELQRLNCGHRHCSECLERNYQYVLDNPASYPAKCCKGLPLTDTSFVLSDAQMRVVLELQQTHEASKIISCFSCQGDIYLSDIGKDAAYCIKCHKLTCTTCRKEMHQDLCPEDPETDSLRNLAKEEGWTQCPKCNRLIHRTAGCNSMVCLCKAHFCFRCANPYPQCKCSTIPRIEGDQAHKSKAEITFGTAFMDGSASRKATFKERLHHRILKDYNRAALKNQENQGLRFKDLKLRQQSKKKDIEMAKEIIKLRVKMNELYQIEKAQKKESTLNNMQNDQIASSSSSGRVIVTRRNVYSWDGKSTSVQDDRPVSKRTRSQK